MPEFVKIFQPHGLNSRGAEDGLPEPEAVIAQNIRFGSGGIEKRAGSVRVCTATTTAKSATFDSASSEYVEVPIDTLAWVLPTTFTVEVLVSAGSTSGARPIFYAGVTTPTMALDITSGNWRWRVWDSAGTLTTVTVGAATDSLVTGLQLVRSGASLTSRLNNVAGGTGTMSATLDTRTPVGALRIARNESTDYFSGIIDYLRGFAVARSNHRDLYVRFPDPKAEYVRFDYGFPASGTTVIDNSRYENHGEAFNTPTVSPSLCFNPAPVRAVSAYVNHSNKKRVLVQAGASLYDAAVP